ncbi:MAG: RsmD family RNA methyltransferase, partial [Chloroflexota bacterium]|nr:RsmD family RNA methyltransferase [Chloroflexota bacterium]
TEPYADTLAKIRAAAPVIGEVLDTTTGLGYTAIQAARTATAVTTIELDPAVLAIARENPWSRDLFENPRIRQLVGDSAEVVAEMPNGAFDQIIHDPPTISLAGELYGGAFYRQLYRVLRSRGRLFHYIGNPESNLGGKVSRGVVRRLHEAGFSRVIGKPEAFGVLATKQ